MEKSESDYNMFDWWKKVVFKNYANFKGRARRAEFWNFILVNILLIIPLYALAIAGMVNENSVFSAVTSLVFAAVFLLLIIPYLAVIVRRLHDINKSGWNYFMGVIPLVGSIILLVWFVSDGSRFDNNYGPDPKAVNMPEFDFEEANQQIS